MKRKERASSGFSIFRTQSKHKNPDTRFYLGSHPTGQRLPYVGLVELKHPEPPREFHSHPNCEIHFVARGRMAFHTPQGLELLSAGDAFIAAPNQVHGNGSFTHVRTSVFTLMLGLTPEDGLTGIHSDHGPRLKKALEKISGRAFRAGPGVGAAFQRIRLLAEGKTPFPELVFQTAICDVVLRLLESKPRMPGRAVSAASDQPLGQSTKLSPGIQESAAFLREHAAEPVDFTSIARRGKLTSSGFRHRFRRELGISPMEFLLRERVRLAASAIRQNKKALTRVALDSGFSSGQYFARIFKKYTGQSPGEYRENPTTLI